MSKTFEKLLQKAEAGSLESMLAVVDWADGEISLVDRRRMIIATGQCSRDEKILNFLRVYAKGSAHDYDNILQEAAIFELGHQVTDLKEISEEIAQGVLTNDPAILDIIAGLTQLLTGTEFLEVIWGIGDGYVYEKMRTADTLRTNGIQVGS